MAESGHEFTGKTVDETIAEGLAKLGLRREQVEIEILNRGSRGIFGLGSEPARVRIVPHSQTATAETTSSTPSSTVTPSIASPTTVSAGQSAAVPVSKSVSYAPEIEEDDEHSKDDGSRQATAVRDLAGEAMDDDLPYRSSSAAAPATTDEALTAMSLDMLRRMVELMGFRAEVVASWHLADSEEHEPYLLLDIRGDELGALIGRRGETLASIQYLLRLMVNQRIKQWKNIVVDVEQYKERRVAQLTQLALRMAEQVAQSGRAVSLEPMPPNERRIVHLALRDHPTVYTQSSGEGDRRKVHIVAKG
jgi:spoIIIJ-associated protein